MSNPESITIDTMYSYQNHTNIPWNLKEYCTPQEYLDPEMQVKQRKYQSQKKGIKDNKYVTKRGFYMDYDLKVAKAIPSTHVHGQQKEWDFQSMRKKSANIKIDKNLKKHTYIDQIQIDYTKKRSPPGIAHYSLQKSIKQIEQENDKLKKKKVSTGEKLFFYQNTELLSDRVPGAGNYNPHDSVDHVKANKTDYKFWTEKHKKELEVHIKRQTAKPSPITYKPHHMTISTFDDMLHSPKNSKVKNFGGDARFEYTRPVKRKIVEVRPSPNSHSTIMEWKGKVAVGSPKGSQWQEMLWKGNTISIFAGSVYH